MLAERNGLGLSDGSLHCVSDGMPLSTKPIEDDCPAAMRCREEHTEPNISEALNASRRRPLRMVEPSNTREGGISAVKLPRGQSAWPSIGAATRST